MSNIKIFYLHDNKKNRHVTVARILNGDEVLFAYSMNNPKDTFNKKVGRAIAIGRLVSNVGNDESYRVKLLGRRAIVAILEVISKENCFPNSLRRLAEDKLWTFSLEQIDK